jgi:hypothetical protein
VNLREFRRQELLATLRVAQPLPQTWIILPCGKIGRDFRIFVICLGNRICWSYFRGSIATGPTSLGAACANRQKETQPD